MPRRRARPFFAARVAGCGILPASRDGDGGTISRQRFVDTYMALVQARIDTEGDPAAYAAARDLVLDQAGVRPSDLRAFVEAGRDDPERLQEAWRDIAARLDTLYGGVTTQPPPELSGVVEEGAVGVEEGKAAGAGPPREP